jgi:AcrR family transcriptional regulator
MIRFRLRPAGFDARPERLSSERAQAQCVFRAASERCPLPDLLPQAGEGKEELTPLTLQVRALYEGSAVPVREIARLAGVNERTLYRYVAKGGWRRRYGGKGIAAAVEKRAQTRKPGVPCRTAKGAGGRFIRSEDAGKPVPRGLKALDPQGRARALALCERAGALSDEAVKRTRRLREAMSDARTMALMAGVLRDLMAIEDAAAIEDVGRPAVVD